MDTQTLNDALVAQFPQPASACPAMDTETLLTRLYDLQCNGFEQDSVRLAIGDVELTPLDHAVIAFLDEELTETLQATEPPTPIARAMNSVVAAVARIAIADGILVMTRSPAIPIADAMFALGYGWSDLGGRALAANQQKLDEALQSLHLATAGLTDNPAFMKARNNLLELLEADLVNFVSSERDRIRKLEQRLADTATGQLTAERSRKLATRRLNAQMAGRILPAEVVNFLKGVWFDSLLLIGNRKGTNSPEWQRAHRLTETLISTLQPAALDNSPGDTDIELEDMLAEAEINLAEGDIAVEFDEFTIDVVIEETLPDVQPAEAEPTPAGMSASDKPAVDQTLYRIIENLSDELREMLVAIAHDEEAIDAALAEIETTHVKILKGESIEGCEFELLPDSDEMLSDNARLSNSLLQPVQRLNPGDWFVFHDDFNRARHFKLTLKDDESQQLIFTNRNGGNALQSSFQEFAVLLSSGRSVPMPRPGELLKNIRRRLMNSLKRKVKDDEIAEQRRQRAGDEALAQAMADTRFLLVAVPRCTLRSPDTADLTISADTLKALAAEHDQPLLFVDQTGLGLRPPDVDSMQRLMTGASIEMPDEMPVGMSTFRETVQRLRGHPKLAAVS